MGYKHKNKKQKQKLSKIGTNRNPRSSNVAKQSKGHTGAHTLWQWLRRRTWLIGETGGKWGNSERSQDNHTNRMWKWKQENYQRWSKNDQPKRRTPHDIKKTYIKKVNELIFYLPMLNMNWNPKNIINSRDPYTCFTNSLAYFLNRGNTTVLFV